MHIGLGDGVGERVGGGVGGDVGGDVGFFGCGKFPVKIILYFLLISHFKLSSLYLVVSQVQIPELLS